MLCAANSLLVTAELKCPKTKVLTCRPMGCETLGRPFPASGKETVGTGLPQAPKQARGLLLISLPIVLVKAIFVASLNRDNVLLVAG